MPPGPLKIALITPGGVARGGEGAVIPCLLWLIENLAEAGHEVHVFALRQEPLPGTWQLLGATVYNAGRRPRRLRLLRALLAEHRRKPFDVIHAFWTGVATLAAIAGKALGVPLVVTFPGGDPVSLPEIGYGGRQTLRGRVHLRIAARAAAHVTVPSDFMRRLAADLGIAATTVPLGVDLRRWPPAPPRRRAAQTPLRLLHAASLNRVKDQPTLLHALELLKSRGLPFRLRVAGFDTLDGAIQRLVVQLGLGEDVQFVGLLPQAQLREEFLHADLLVMASRHEAGPLVMLEAALAGVPTVGTAVGHIADHAPGAALAVPVGRPAALADAIATLAGDEPRRLRMARAAQAIAIRDDASHTAETLSRIYREARRDPAAD